MGIKSWDMIQRSVERSDRLRATRLKEYKENKDFRSTVAEWAEEKINPGILSDKQRMAIYFLTDFVHNYSYNWIACRVNVSETTLIRWRNTPLFLRELDREISRRRSFIRLHAFRNVNRAIMRGDMKATWNYLKMSGDLKENVNITDDRTGEKELGDAELLAEISKLQLQLSHGSNPSSN